jgi:uncharacterized protein YjiS (DUF1127 family)
MYYVSPQKQSLRGFLISMTSHAALSCQEKSSLRPLAWLPRLLRRLAHSWQRSRGIEELKALPDAQLRDIGLDRRDVGPLIDQELDRFRSW